MFRVVRAEEKNCYNILAGKLDASVLDEQLIVAQYITLHNETAYLLSTPFLLFAKDAGTDRALLTIHTTMPLLVKMFRGGQLLEDVFIYPEAFMLPVADNGKQQQQQQHPGDVMKAAHLLIMTAKGVSTKDDKTDPDVPKADPDVPTTPPPHPDRGCPNAPYRPMFGPRLGMRRVHFPAAGAQ